MSAGSQVRRRHVVALLLIAGCSADPLTTLRGDLKSSDAEVRQRALGELGAMGEAAGPAVGDVVPLIRDSAPAVRQAACRALGDIGKPAASKVPELETALVDETWSVRLAAAFAILKLDPTNAAPRPILNEAMTKGEGGTIVAVGQLGADAAWAVPTLVALLKDPRPGTRRLAADALGNIGEAAIEAVTALERAAHDTDDRVRAAAEEAFNRLQEASRETMPVEQ